jgi:signal transduction histidine kinase
MKAPMSDREANPRTTASGVVVAEEAVSSSRSVVLPDLPARWLDRLLVATCELPVTLGEEAVVRAVLEAVAGTLPSLVFGAVLVSAAGRRVIGPPTATDASEPDPPGRLFPHLAHERVVRVPDAGDSTLHVASDDPSLELETAPAVQLLQRAAFIARSGLETARAHARAAETKKVLDQREAMLVQAEKLATLGQLASALVHELNNPLTSIVAYTDFLTKRAHARLPAVDPDEIERLRRIGESATRMLRFTRDIVQYARPSTTRGPVIISGVIDQALSFCEHVIDESNVTVERRFGHGVLPVAGAAEQLAQVFVNLVTNACHAMAETGGLLVVSTELVMEDTRVRVTVEDDGHGIDPTNVPRIFEPFFTTKPEGRGSGLGLAIVRSIVEAHDGTIAVAASAPRGTRFTLLLPVASHERPSRA